MDFYIVVVVVEIAVVVELRENLRLLKKTCTIVYAIMDENFQLSSDCFCFYVKVKHKFSLKAAKLNALGVYSLYINVRI